MFFFVKLLVQSIALQTKLKRWNLFAKQSFALKSEILKAKLLLKSKILKAKQRGWNPLEKNFESKAFSLQNSVLQWRLFFEKTSFPVKIENFKLILLQTKSSILNTLRFSCLLLKSFSRGFHPLFFAKLFVQSLFFS